MKVFSWRACRSPLHPPPDAMDSTSQAISASTTRRSPAPHVRPSADRERIRSERDRLPGAIGRFGAPVTRGKLSLSLRRRRRSRSCSSGGTHFSSGLRKRLGSAELSFAADSRSVDACPTRPSRQALRGALAPPPPSVSSGAPPRWCYPPRGCGLSPGGVISRWCRRDGRPD
jgi:hypothetical protein